jgi:hypothetical protein
MEMAEIKEEAVESAAIDGKNISAYVSLAYDALREILEAICISRGYKVLSHICMGEFLRSVIGESDYKEFDRLRYTRNGINYYGSKVELGQGKDIIAKTFSMKKRLAQNFLKEFRGR